MKVTEKILWQQCVGGGIPDAPLVCSSFCGNPALHCEGVAAPNPTPTFLCGGVECDMGIYSENTKEKLAYPQAALSAD